MRRYLCPQPSEGFKMFRQKVDVCRQLRLSSAWTSPQRASAPPGDSGHTFSFRGCCFFTSSSTCGDLRELATSTLLVGVSVLINGAGPSDCSPLLVWCPDAIIVFRAAQSKYFSGSRLNTLLGFPLCPRGGRTAAFTWSSSFTRLPPLRN